MSSAQKRTRQEGFIEVKRLCVDCGEVLAVYRHDP
jgi:hypothetical protein